MDRLPHNGSVSTQKKSTNNTKLRTLTLFYNPLESRTGVSFAMFTCRDGFVIEQTRSSEVQWRENLDASPFRGRSKIGKPILTDFARVVTCRVKAYKQCVQVNWPHAVSTTNDLLSTCLTHQIPPPHILKGALEKRPEKILIVLLMVWFV